MATEALRESAACPWPQSWACGPVDSGEYRIAPAPRIAHPWAGAQLVLRLHAEDGAGQAGTTEPLTITLPEPGTTAMFAGAFALVGGLFAARRRLF